MAESRREHTRWLTTFALVLAVLATFRVADAARSSVGFRDGGLHHPHGGLDRRAGLRDDGALGAGGRLQGGDVHGDAFVDNGGDGGFKDAFLSSISMILVSELGDETFIIAAIMAMRHPRVIIFAGAIGALAVMTVLSTALGLIVPNLISQDVVNKCAFVLYTFFGCRLLYIAWRADPNASIQEEMQEVETKLEAGPGSGTDDGTRATSLRAGVHAHLPRGVRTHLPRGVGGQEPDHNHRARRAQEPVRGRRRRYDRPRVLHRGSPSSEGGSSR
jgi:hypothetical protein